METKNYIECKKNSHGSVLYVYTQSPQSEINPELFEEIILPESSDDVYKVVSNDQFIVASFINHGLNLAPGAGGVMVYKKRNDGKFHFIQTIKLDLSKVEITDKEDLNFGLDVELTDDNLFITCEPTINDGDKHSYIGIYEYGEFYWELVQEFYGPATDAISFKIDEFAYDELTGKSIFGGVNSLAASETDFVFNSNISPNESRELNQHGFFSCVKLNGTWVVDYESPILHPQVDDENFSGDIVENTRAMFGKPVISGKFLAIPSYKLVKNSDIVEKLSTESDDDNSFIPCVLLYKKDEDGAFKFYQYLEYDLVHRVSKINNYENIVVQLNGDHLVCYSDFDVQTTLGDKIEPRYYQIDTTEKVRLSDSIKDFIWKQNTEFNFDDLKKPFVLGGCPLCAGEEPECGEVVLHLQSTSSEDLVSDVCDDAEITDVENRPAMCDCDLTTIEAESGYVFKPLKEVTNDVFIDYTQSYNQNSSNRWVSHGDYSNSPIVFSTDNITPDTKLPFLHISDGGKFNIIEDFSHATHGMKCLQGTLRASAINQGDITYTFTRTTMVVAVTSLTNSWSQQGNINSTWTQYTPKYTTEARDCWTIFYKIFEPGEHTISNLTYFLYFRPLDLLPTTTPTPIAEPTPTPTPERTPTPTPTYFLHDMITYAGRPDKDGLVLISWEGRDECLPYIASGRDRRFIVPDGVTQINVQCWGAGGGSGRYRYAGGAGGYAEGKLDVQPGELYIIGVGKTAKSHKPQYSPGGSAGEGGTGAHRGAGAGGGMSGIFKNSISAANALIIAGGGGGSSGSYQIRNTGGGGGGGSTAGHGMRYRNDGKGGKGGTQSAGGVRGNSLAWSRNSSSGGRFRGGRGGTAGHSSGGGGGAGWFGGGGGGALMAADSAGGGGSGYIHSSVIEGKMYRGDNGASGNRNVASHLPNPMPCDFLMPTPTPERTPTPTPDCPKIKWSILDFYRNTISMETPVISVSVSKLDTGLQRYNNIKTGMLGLSSDWRVIQWNDNNFSSISDIKLVLCDGTEHDPIESDFTIYQGKSSTGADSEGLTMSLTFGVEPTPTPIPQPDLPPVGDDPDIPDVDDPDTPVEEASNCDTQYLLLQPATDDTAILDKGSETFDITETGETKLDSDTTYFDLPTIKVANGDESYPPNNVLETNIGDMIIGTNDFTIETLIKFDDVNQDHRIISHDETSRNRSSWSLHHRGDRKENNGEEGRWFQWLVNNGHGSTSASNNWINHIAFLSPISLENNTWYHIALVRKNVTNWTLYVNGQKHEKLTNRFLHSSAYSFGTYSGSIPSFSGPTYIGYNYYSTSGAYYMQSFRVTNVAVYADEFNVPTSALGVIDHKPMCKQIALDLNKSDSDDSIIDTSDSNLDITTDLKYADGEINFNEETVTLSYNVRIPNHSESNLANGTYSESHQIKITEDTTVTDFKFKYSATHKLGVADGSTWQVLNQKITYADGTSQTIELRDRKLTPHNDTGHHLCFTFDVVYKNTNADNIIVVGNNSDLNFLHNGTTDYTIECNFKVTKWHNSPVHVNWSPSRLFSSIMGSSRSVAIDCIVLSDSFANASSTTSATDGRLIFNIHRGEQGTVYKAFKTPAGSIHLNTEYKLAIVFSGGKLKVFLNGVAQDNEGTGYTVKNSASKSNASKPLVIGAVNSVSRGLVAKFHGIISKFRIVRSALYNCNYDVDSIATDCFNPRLYPVNDPEGEVRLLVRALPETGATDIGCRNYHLSSVGNVNGYYQTNKLFDSGVINLDGSSHIAIPSSRQKFSFLHNGLGTPYTVETWVRVASTKQYQTALATCSWTGETGFMVLIHNLKPQVVVGKSTPGAWRLNCVSNKSLILNQWHHVAFSVDNLGKCKLFIDGQVVGEAKFNDSVTSLSTSDLVIGAEADGKNKLIGQMQDVRISTSTVYTGRFSVPASLHPVECENYCIDPQTEVEICPNEVKLHLQSNTFTSEDPIVDSSDYNNSVKEHGNVLNDKEIIEFGRSSYKFDGNDYLEIGDNSTFDFIHNGTSEFTIETWCNIGALTYDTINRKYMVLLSNTNISSSVGFTVYFNSDGLSFYITRGEGGTAVTYISTPMSDQDILNNWIHVAVSYDNDKYRLYVNGDLKDESDGNHTNHSSASATKPLLVGWSDRDDNIQNPKLNGYIQDLRITNKTLYYGNCFKLKYDLQKILKSNASNQPSCGEISLNIQSDTSDSEEIIDNSVNSHSITKHGNIAHSTEVSILGQSSLYFDGDKSNYLSLPYSSDWDLGNNDFTIEFWMNSKNHYLGQVNVMILNNSLNIQDGSKSWGWLVYYLDGKVNLLYSPNGVAGSGASNSWKGTNAVTIPSLNEWHHVAFVRSGNIVQTFINGCAMSETDIGDVTIYNPQQPLLIGRRDDAQGIPAPVTNSFNGYLQDIRISKKAVYKDNFLLPTKLSESLIGEPIEPNCEEVVLSIQSNTTNELEEIKDISAYGNEITNINNVKHLSSQKEFGNSSLYFDGNNYLRLQPSSLWNLDANNSDFTIEFSFYLTNNGYGGSSLLGSSPTRRWTFNEVYQNTNTFGPRHKRLWIRRNGSGGMRFGISNATGNSQPELVFGGNTLTELNKWHHVAVVYEASKKKYTMYIDGSPDDTASYVRSIDIDHHYLTIGNVEYWTGHPEGWWNLSPSGRDSNVFGYMQNIRISKSAVYKTCFVPPSTFHPSVIVEPNQPVCGETELSLQAHPTSAETDVVNSSLKDYSMYNKNVTIKPMDIDTNDFRYKSFDFTKGQYLKFGNTSDWNWVHSGTSEFTIESWVYVDKWDTSTDLFNRPVAAFINTAGTSNTVGFKFYSVDKGLNFNITRGVGGTSNVSLAKSNALKPKTWHHIASSFDGTTYRMFVDGLLVDSSTGNELSYSSANSLRSLQIGYLQREDNGGNYPLYGKMQDVRISSKAIYTGCFAPPKKLNSVGVAETTDPVDCRDVKLHLKSDTDGSDVNFVDTSNSAHAFSKVGEVFHSEDVIKYGSSSVYIRNNELSYLTAPVHNDFSFNTDDFTVEFNVYLMNANFAMQSNSVLSTSEPQTIWHLHVTDQSVLFTCHNGGQGLYHETTIERYKWNHIAFVRKSGKLTAFVNGLAVKTIDFTANLLNNGLAIGSHSEASGVYPMSHCYLQDLRISKKAVYENCYYPPVDFVKNIGYIQFQLRDYPNNTWTTHTRSAQEVSIDSSGCMTDFYKLGYCHHNTYSGYNKWLKNDFSDDFRNLKYIDCNGNDVEILPSSVEYKLYSKNCENPPLHPGGAISFKACFDINEKTPTPTPDCKGKITFQSLRYDGVWVTVEKNIEDLCNPLREGCGLIQTDGTLCINEWQYGMCQSNVYATANNWATKAENGSIDSDIKNFKFVDCDGTEHQSTFVEYRVVTHKCGPDENGKKIEWKACFDTDLTTPTPTPVLDPTPTPTPINPDASKVDAVQPNCNDVQLHIQSNTTNESDSIVDDSFNHGQGYNMLKYGQTHHETDVKLFGESSIAFDGNGDYITRGNTETFAWMHKGTTTFTIDGWFNIKGWVSDNSGENRATILATGGTTANTGVWLVVRDNSIVFRVTRGVASQPVIWLSCPAQVAFNNWYHVAVTHDANSNTYSLYLDGIKLGERKPSYNHSSSSSYTPLTIGKIAYGSGDSYFNGYLQDLRISTSLVYSGNFDVPTNLHNNVYNTDPNEPDIGDVKLLIQSDTTNYNDPVEDSSILKRGITKHGDIKHQSGDSIIGNSSIYFDGDRDYLSLPASNDWKFANTDFTIETWVKFDGIQPSAKALGTQSTHGGSANLIQTATNGGLSDNVGWGINMYFDNVSFYWEEGTTTTNWQSVNLLNSSTFKSDVWFHIAVVKHGDVVTGYVNGDPTGSTTISGWVDSSRPLEIGRRTRSPYSNLQYYFRGSIQDLRISRSAVYTGCFVPPSTLHSLNVTEPSEPNCGEVALNIQSNTTNEADAIEDISVNAHVVTKNGDTKHTSDVKVLGDSSLHFDGNGDYLIVENSDNLNFGSSDYTVELWVNTPNTVSTNTNNATQIIGKHTTGSSTNSAWVLLHYTNSKEIRWQAYSGETSSNISVTIPDNTWVHIAVVKNNDTLKMYKDGVLESETTVQNAMNTSTSRTLIGAVNNNGSLDTTNYAQMFNGYIQDIRISKKAVYTGNFYTPSKLSEGLVTEPSEPSCSEVALLINSDNTNEADAITDESINALEIIKSGNTKHQTGTKLFGNSSIYFDGNGDHLDIGDTSTFKFLHNKTTDFTIEGWVYANSVSPHTTLFTTNGGTSSNVGCSTIIYPDGGIYFETYRGVSGTRGIHYGGGDKTLFKFSAWNHVAITFSKSEDKVEIYVNGIEIKGGAGHGPNSPSLANSNIPLTIGRYPTNSTNLNGYIQNFRISKKKVYTGCFVPATEALVNTITQAIEPSCDDVVLNIQSNSTNNADAIIDNSRHVNVIKNVGPARHEIETPLFGSSSLKFGNGDYLMVTDSPKFDLGADDFTIECWFNPTSLRSENHNGWTPIINHHRTGNNSDCAFDFSHYNNKSIACYIFSGSNYISLTKTDILTYGEWHHLAVVRSGSRLIGFLNGQIFAEKSIGTKVVNTSSQALKVGKIFAGGTSVSSSYTGNFLGYIQDIKITKKALYTGCFITANSLSDINTALPSDPSCTEIDMHLQSNVNTKQHIKLTANIRIPGHHNTAYRNGTYVRTLNFYINKDETIVDQRFVHSTHERVGREKSSTWTVTNAKLHYPDGTIVDAQLRDRKNVRETVSHGRNGMQDGHSVKYTFDLAYTKDVVEIVDESINSHSLTKNGNVRHLSDDKSLFGESSLYFDGNNDQGLYVYEDYLETTEFSDFDSDYTIETWLNVSSIPAKHGWGNNLNPNKNIGMLLDTRGLQGYSTSADGMVINMVQDNSENGFKLRHYTTDTGNSNPIKETPLLSFNTWYHIAVVRNGDNEKLFVDGVVVAERTYNHTYKVHRIRIGEGAFGTDSNSGQWPTNPLHGYIQDFRISKKAVYTGCFSPPTALFPDESSEPNEPTCNEVELNIQSDVNTTESVTLSQCVQIPGHPDSQWSNGRCNTWGRNLVVTPGETYTDFLFFHSQVTSLDTSNWRSYDVKLTYSDGTIIPITLRDKKAVREPYNHPDVGLADGYAIKYTFDIPLHTTKTIPEIKDNSRNEYAITKVGDVKHTSEVKVLGESSLYFDGSGDHLEINQNSTLNLTGNFTLEGWFYFVDIPDISIGAENHYGVITCWPNNNTTDKHWQLVFTHDQRLIFGFNGHSTTHGGSSAIYENLPLNQWHHVAVVGNQDVVKMYVNGTPTEGSYTGHTKYSSWIEHPIYIGKRDTPHVPAGSNSSLYGKFYAQDIKLTKKAVYTGCFIPRSDFLPNDCPTPTPTPTLSPTPTPVQDPTPTPTFHTVEGVTTQTTVVGDKNVVVKENIGEFAVGDCVTIGKGTAKEESHKIVKITNPDEETPTPTSISN